MTLESSARKMVSENKTATRTTMIPAVAGSKALNYIDISDPNEPQVVIKGWGTLPLEFGYGEIARRLKDTAAKMESGRMPILDFAMSMRLIEVGGSPDQTAHLIQAFAEAEILLQTPAAKTALTKAKSARG